MSPEAEIRGTCGDRVSAARYRNQFSIQVISRARPGIRETFRNHNEFIGVKGLGLASGWRQRRRAIYYIDEFLRYWFG